MNKISKFSVLLGAFAALVLPVITFAQDAVTDIQGTFAFLLGTLQQLVPVILGIAIILFLWGLLKFIMATDEGARKEGRGFMIWGIIVLFVMVSIWGLVNILVGGVFGGDDSRIDAIQGPNVDPGQNANTN